MTLQSLAAPLRHCHHVYRPSLPRLSRQITAPTSISSIFVITISSHSDANVSRKFSRTSLSTPHFPFSTSTSARFARPVGFEPQGLRLPGPSMVEEGSDEGSYDSEGAAQKSRNQKKREARRAVKWGMELAEFSPPQIKRILRVVSAEEEVYDALMLVKRLGPDVREGKRRQFSYIGRLLRDVQPELMDALIQASKDNDNNKLQALYSSEKWTDKDDEEEEEETDSEDCQECTDKATRWLDGLANKDSSITKEVYSLQNVEFDRQELRKLVRKIHTDEAETFEENGGETVALTKAKNNLLFFLQRLAKQMLLTS